MMAMEDAGLLRTCKIFDREIKLTADVNSSDHPDC